MNAFPRSPSAILRALLLLTLVLAVGGCSLMRARSDFDPDRATATGSGDVLTAEDIKRYPGATSVEELLELHFSGVYVQRYHHKPGGDGDVHMLGSSAPLFVIDGVPVPHTGSLGLNPRDIESIELVKFGGTALYGLRGASGVILITTRKD